MIKVQKLVLLLYLAIFPFGQLPTFLLTLYLNRPISLHLADMLLGFYVFLSCVHSKQLLYKVVNSYLSKMLVVLLFSSVIGYFIFGLGSIVSLLYLLRLSSQLLFGFALYIQKPLTKDEVSTFVLSSSLTIATLGLIQYLLLPDTRFLSILGWDDHYFRLLSTFFDPAFTGIILALSLLYLFFSNQIKRNKLYWITVATVFVSLLLTYSRASYLAFAGGFIFYFIYKKKINLKILVLLVLFPLSLFLLPRPDGEGVRLERTASLFLKLENAKDTLKLWHLSPIFGVGYNNICSAKKLQDIQQTTDRYSHACAGADNSFLFLLATTGICGLFMFLHGYMKILMKFGQPLFISLSVAVLIHTQFTNTLFYSWILGWFAIFLSNRE